MIKKVTMFTVLCDRCGKDACEGTDWSCWDSPEAVRECSSEGWENIDEKDYCPACLTWNEDESELIPKPEPVEPKEQK